MVDSVAQEFGVLDVLINNAGVFFDHPMESSSYEPLQQAWADTSGVNLIGAANVTWCALQHMPKNSTSRIVNIGPRGAFRGEPVSPAYGASKAAIVAFGQSIAKALAPMKIGVTTLALGFVETDMAARLLDGPKKVTGSGRRVPSIVWQGLRSWPRRSTSWPRLRVSGPAGRSWISMGPLM